MHRCLTSTFALFICCVAFCQKTVFSYQPFAGKKASKLYSYYSHVAVDTNTGKTTVLINNNKDDVEYLLLRKDFSIEKKMQIPLGTTLFEADWHKFLGANAYDGGSNLFYLVKDKRWDQGKFHVRMETADFVSQKISSKTLLPFRQGEEFINFYTVGQTAVLIYANDNTSQLIFHVVDAHGKVVSRLVDMNLAGYNKKNLKLSEYLSDSRVYLPHKPSELITATALTKIFSFPEQLVMLISGLDEPPHMWTIDTRRYVAARHKLNMEGFEGSTGRGVDAFNIAHLYHSKLYLLNTSKNRIEVGIFDFPSGQLVKKLEITDFANFPFAEEPSEVITRHGHAKTNRITSTKELIKELSRGYSGVSVATNNKGHVVLTCGVYSEQVRDHGYWARAPMGGQEFFKTGTYELTRTVNFKVILDPKDFSIVKSSNTLSEIDRVNRFFEDLGPKVQAESKVDGGDKNLVCYYDPSDKTFYIKQIN